MGTRAHWRLSASSRRYFLVPSGRGLHSFYLLSISCNPRIGKGKRIRGTLRQQRPSGRPWGRSDEFLNAEDKLVFVQK